MMMLRRIAAGLVAIVLVVTPSAGQTPTAPSRTTAPHKTPAKQIPSKPRHKPAAKPAKKTAKRSKARERVYRTGHGNEGFGTIKTPPRYTAPLPPAAKEPEAGESTRGGVASIDFPTQLDGFFSHLDAADPAMMTTRILQFGDSHTAADMFTGRMRSLFQARFGNGGAGFSYAGHPFAGYRILGTGRGQSAGWVSEGVHFTQIVNTQLGLGGVAETATREGETLWVDAPCTRMELEYMDQPGGGSFTLSEDGAALTELSTDSTMKSVDEPLQTLTATCTAGTVHHFEVKSEASGPVRLLGFVTEQPGITYEALGLNGAEAGLMLRWDQPMFTGYLRQRDPALIVLAYGTNEAGNHNWTYEAYRALFSRLVDQLHATVPSASILVIGPPDRSLRSGRGRHAKWAAFTQTLHITDAQRDTCRTHGCAFWSWRDRMGGLGSMNRWVAEGLAQPDHTHFNSPGYVQLAEYFYSDIIAAYTAWKSSQAQTGTSPHSPL